MLVTQIKRRSKYFLVTIDEIDYKIIDEIMLKYAICTNKEFDTDTLTRALMENEIKFCFEVALSFVSKCLKTIKQTKDYLYGKGYHKPAIENAIDKLVEYGYLDDKAFSKSFIETYKDNKGKMYIKSQLYSKGVDSKLVDELLNTFKSDEKTISKIAQKFMKNKDKSLENKQKLYSHLLSKGFTYEEAKIGMKLFGGEDESWN